MAKALRNVEMANKRKASKTIIENWKSKIKNIVSKCFQTEMDKTVKSSLSYSWARAGEVRANSCKCKLDSKILYMNR